MKFPVSIFKAYDIRGESPGEITSEFAERLGRAFPHFTDAKTVVVGRDARKTSPELADALIKGIISQGVDVIDIGMVSTPMFYFAVGEYELHDAGIMVTASHNPAKYNGFKLVRGDAFPIGANSGMYELRDLVTSDAEFPNQKIGNVVETDISEAYLEKIFSLVDPETLKQFNLAIDNGNGMGGVILPRLLKAIPGWNSVLYMEPDGNFPNHEANPLKEETLDDLKKLIKEKKSDLGAAFDGDADRIGFVDENGAIVSGDLITGILAARILEEHPGSPVLYDVRSSWATKEAILVAGGKPIMCPVGHALVKKMLRDTGAAFGGEVSMHYYFRDFYNGMESSDLAFLILLSILTDAGKTLSELVAPHRKYFHSGEINFKVEDKEGKFKEIEEKYKSGAKEIIRIDGIRMEFNDWWLNLRASNTEPLMRLNLEAKSESKMREMKEEISNLLRV
ncbi:phosphomannomutase/phosphoglucomutase [Candidatus Uhrbacteria bacterium]|nr:phosphomannomutase/phosphoglucomutase [Candidatus Uhrbacteria bacterium]